LDIAFSLRDSQSLITEFKENTAYLACILFVGSFMTLFFLIYLLIKLPLERIEGEARIWARGERPPRDSTDRRDEIGQLSQAIHRMGSELIDKNTQLVLQKDLYQDLFEGVPCLVTVQDRDYRLLRFNRFFAENFNAQVGEYCYKAYKNRDAPCLDCPVKKTFETGRSHCTEETGYYKDGARAHWIVTTSPIHDSRGELVAAMEMCLDITSRKDLERALKRSERKYHDIFNNVPAAILVLGQGDLSILDCNRGALAAYGYPRSELLRLSFVDLFMDGRDDGAIEAVRAGRAIERARHVTRDGHPFYVSMHASPSEFASRKVHLVTVTDITTRLETEQQLIQASKMATLGEMATGVAHEINQPLSVIQTSIDLIKRHLARGEVPAEGVLTRITGLVASQVDRAAKIIAHMREFGRKSDQLHEKVDCNAVLTRAFDFFSQQLTLRGIEVVFELAEALPPVRCDPNRLEQVCINLLTNARDAIEERSARDAAAPRRVTLKTMANQEYVTLRVGDTGPGVPPELAEKIFEPFFTTKEIGKGTGLGLSISYGIVKESGGAISVSTNADGGANFHIRLPVARD
ncbi:MAG TPA: ATP-binding protein, partial [Holophaga sp.]|nr:ATP-binding protein [Holophaga sp.]